MSIPENKRTREAVDEMYPPAFLKPPDYSNPVQLIGGSAPDISLQQVTMPEDGWVYASFQVTNTSFLNGVLFLSNVKVIQLYASATNIIQTPPFFAKKGTVVVARAANGSGTAGGTIRYATISYYPLLSEV
jgi:hypothetical protein